MSIKKETKNNKMSGNFQEILKNLKGSERYEIEEVRDLISENIHKAMLEHGIKKAELARRLNTSAAYITKLLQGNGNFTIETLVRIARALGYKFKPIFISTHAGWKPVSREIVESANFQTCEKKLTPSDRFMAINHFAGVLDKAQINSEVSNESLETIAG